MKQKLKGKIIKIKRSEVIQLANKYIGNDSLESQNKILLKISTAIAARISYTALGDNPKIDYEADIKLNDRLLKSKHLSCFEHCAKAMYEEEYKNFRKGYTTASFKWKTRGWCNNFKNFIQYCYLIDNEKNN